jgi:hypothetical protein
MSSRWLALLNEKLSNIQDQDTQCPVYLESFTDDNLPYITNTCCHHFSIKALDKLPIRKLGLRDGTILRHFNCPTCRTMFTHANLDIYYLEVIKLKREVAYLSTLDETAPNSTVKLSSFLNYNTGTSPVTYQPRKGILSVLKQLNI